MLDDLGVKPLEVVGLGAVPVGVMGDFHQRASPCVSRRVARIDGSGPYQVKEVWMIAKAGRRRWRKDVVDVRRVTLAVGDRESFVAYRGMHHGPAPRPEPGLAVGKALLHAKLRFVILTVDAEPVVGDLCGIAPARSNAPVEAAGERARRQQTDLDQFVVLE